MEVRLANLFAGDLGLDVFAMPRGDHHLEVIEPGDAVVLLVVRGLLYVVYQGPRKLGRRRVAVQRGRPLVLVQPGTYAVYAEAGTLGFRGARGGAAGRVQTGGANNATA